MLLPLVAYRAYAIDIDKLLATFNQIRGSTPQAFNAWQKLLVEGKDLPAQDKLKRVNEFFNRRISFEDDKTVWGQTDYWATPMETLARGKGDCEDFAIAKYFTLLSLNVPVQQLRFIYVKARIGGASSTIEQAHMVLAFYPSPEAEPLVLDNLITEIRPASRRPDLQPVFSFNSQGLFSGTDANAAQGTGGVGQLSRWSDLLQRVRAEGFN